MYVQGWWFSDLLVATSSVMSLLLCGCLQSAPVSRVLVLVFCCVSRSSREVIYVKTSKEHGSAPQVPKRKEQTKIHESIQHPIQADDLLTETGNGLQTV